MTNTEQIDVTQVSHPGELAHTLESLPQAERAELWATTSVEDRGAVLPFLHDEIKSSLIEQATVEELQDLAENMAAGDVADVIEMVPDHVAQDIVDSLSEEVREQVQESLSYNDEMAGRWLRRDELRFAPTRSVKQVLDYIRRNGLPK